jgi:hypothetical protein
MLSRVHNKLGTAGLVVAIVALIAALAGGAYAASGGLTPKQKKQVETIAKKVSKPGPAGPQGNPGPQGSPGTNGKDGSNGVSPVGTVFPGNANGCKEGGVKFVGANTTVACNGAKGADGQTGFTKTLPLGETETGTVSFETVPNNGLPFRFTNLSFAIPLEEAVSSANIHLVNLAETTTECPGSFEDPAAIVSGGESVLCIYKGLVFVNVSSLTPLPTKTGVFLNVAAEEADKTAVGIASFAVTAG